MEIGTILAAARKRAQLTQRELAQRLGISATYLSDMEQGRRAFGEKFLDDLPPDIRAEVRPAFIAEYEAAIARLNGC